MFTINQRVKTKGRHGKAPYSGVITNFGKWKEYDAAMIRKDDGTLVRCLIQNLVLDNNHRALAQIPENANVLPKLETKPKPEIKFHDNRCDTCMFYRVQHGATLCMLLSHTLSLDLGSYIDKARYCDGWEKRPPDWFVRCSDSPYWKDKHIPRERLEKIRATYGMEG